MLDSNDLSKRALDVAKTVSTEKKLWRKRLKNAFILSGVCIVILAVMIMVYPLIDPSTSGGTQIDDGNVPLLSLPMPDDDARPYSGSQGESNPVLVIPSYERFAFTAEDLIVRAALLNPEGNRCCLTFEIVLVESGDSIYLSGIVEPGLFIEDIMISRSFQKGEYRANLIIRAYEPGSVFEFCRTSMPVGLVVE